MRFPGIIPAVTTPFDEHGDIQTDALRDNVEQMIAAGVHGLSDTTSHKLALESTGSWRPGRWARAQASASPNASL
jgi:hypothetical protein